MLESALQQDGISQVTIDACLTHPVVQACLSSTMGLPGLVLSLEQVMSMHKGLPQLRYDSPSISAAPLA